ncbi:hypothetical protein BUALT_Bualt08G0023800 [Buddleja alternifolia]|uniref:C2 NT-type domain-containing protein n=1 Tax=Buddleja alternifolia TaxID=168488 RepID=A0AAV6XDY5_9LAMI|nr:hypothetical protein BUALT_Bualt08G0023800 [Buddleja alternifolia]
MSRISKWKLEKTKVKVVFRLQFHASHIPQSGWDKLFITFIPADSGKTSAKTTKANVRNGTCKWADPIYETTRLLQDSKSKQYDEKLYKIVVAMGSSRASILGEATINLADYVDAVKPSAVSLPLHGCSFGTILHITIQLLTSKTGFREFEQQRELREGGLQSMVDCHDHNSSGKIPYPEEVTIDQINKVSARINFKADANELSSVEEEVNLNEEYADSAAGFDNSSNTSGSLYAEKHETFSTHEIDSLKSTTSGDVHMVSHGESPNTEKGDLSANSMDNELAMAREENNQLRGSLELAESSLFNLKLEVASLHSMTDELGTETQKFSHLLAAEVSTSQHLAKEVSVMKLECFRLKDDIIKLKDLKFSPQIPIMETSDNQVDHLVRNMQLQFLKGIALVEGKIRELQNKAYVVPLGGDAKHIYLELETLLNFVMDFKLEYGLPSERTNTKEIREVSTVNEEQFVVSGNGLGLDLCQPESILLSITSPVSEVVNPANVIDAMKGQIFDLVRELDDAKVEKEGLIRKMDQMECYYEALIHELEENQKRMLGELQHLRNEHSTCLYTLSSSRAEIESVHLDMNEQMSRFVDERNDLEAINKELEKRATTSEAALRRARLNYSIAVDKLQKDLELLSSQVMSMFETNENLIKQALPSQPHLIRDQDPQDYATILSTAQNQNLCLRKRSVGGDILLEDLKRSFCMQEELYQKVEQELIEMYSVNLGLDIYSKALQESFCEANDEMGIMKDKIGELMEELKLSTASQNKLLVRLQKATDDIHTLSEFKSSSISQCSDMALQNQLLEDKLVSISEKNDLLLQKLKDLEGTMMGYRSENAELSYSLEQEAFENEKLQNEISILKEKLTILEGESDKLLSFKENLEENISFAQDKVAKLLASYSKQFCPLANSRSLNLESIGIKDAILQLEEIQHNASSKISELMEENRNIESERIIAEVSLSTAKSENLAMKQKFKSEIQDMVTKLDLSNAIVENLQVELESVANKLHLSSEIEEKHSEQNEVLLADLALLEEQMEELTCKDGLLDQEISGLDTLAEELGRSKLTITELINDKQELTMCLEDKTEESIKLSCEISSLNENLRNLHDQLHKENLKEDISFVQDKLVNLLESYNMQFYPSADSRSLNLESMGIKDAILQLEEIQRNACFKISQLMEENRNLESERVVAEVSLSTARSEILAVKQKFKGDIQEMVAKVDLSNALVEKLQVELESVANKLHLSSEIEEKHAEQNKVLLADVALLEDQMHELTCEDGPLAHDISGVDALAEELWTSKLTITELIHDKQELTVCLKDKNEESMKLSCEIICLNENLRNLHDELHKEKGCKDELEGKVRDLTSHLNRDQDKLLDFEQQKAEVMHVKELASDLELEKSRLSHLSDQQKLFIENLKENNSYQASSLESQLLEMHDYPLEAEVKLIYVANQYEAIVKELQSKLMSSEVSLGELQKRYHDIEAMLNNCLEREAQWNEEKADLLTSLRSMKSELEASNAQNKLLSDSNNDISDQLDECHRKLKLMETNLSLDKNLQASEVEQLKIMMIDAEQEINYLIVSKEELEISVIVLKGKVDEQSADVTLLEEYKDELMRLRSQCTELSHKLSEQVLKTEEFKNLSTHLKELKDKAEAEYLVAREKREPVVQPVAAQDSLRIAFIKEQYETKIQELKQQLSISKKHGEEMLMKLQDAIDEIENRKKSEAVKMKRNEELSVKLLELEEELQSVLVEKREKSNGYDRIKAELECALLSLECCKEEKEKLEALLLEFEAQKSQLADELTSIKGQLEILKSSVYGTKKEHGKSSPDSENADLTEPLQLHRVQDVTPKRMDEIPEASIVEELFQSNGKILDVKSEHLRAQKLRSSMEHLHEELEKMKNENTVFNIGHDVDPGVEVSEREIMQLHKANEELRSMFPLFNEISSGGNALERVLALEIELAEAMKSKNKSSVQFQSSFLKQHSDEEAVLKSFRDINELIKEMLELKGRHGSMESELQEMHQRYSQLSLQFAEVEGERQKLKMTLKSVRSSRNLNRSSSANLTMDHTP